MGQLRDRMEQDLKLKGVSPATIRNYLLYCRKFAAFFMRSPEELGAAEVRALTRWLRNHISANLGIVSIFPGQDSGPTRVALVVGLGQWRSDHTATGDSRRGRERLPLHALAPRSPKAPSRVGFQGRRWLTARQAKPPVPERQPAS
jgi:Phage integrase, N-terminal SAM-like domain